MTRATSSAQWGLPLVAVGLMAWLDALVGGDLGSGILGVLVGAATAVLAGWRSRPGPLAASAVTATVLLAVADQVAAPGQFSVANDTVFYAVLVGGPAVVGALLAARSRQINRLTSQVGELERRRGSVVLAARAGEVDRVQQRVTAALSGRLQQIIDGVDGLDGAEVGTADGPGLTRLADLETAARSALTDLRGVLGVLGARPALQVRAPATPPSRPRAALVEPVDGRLGVRSVDRCDVLLFLACLPLAVETSTSGSGSGWIVGNLLAAGLQGLSLPVVRRWPVIGALVLMSVATVQTALLAPIPPLVSWLLPGLLAVFLVGRHPWRRLAFAGLVVAVGGDLVVTWATPAPDRALSSLAPGLVMCVVAWWAGRTVAARERRSRRLADVALELARTEDAELRAAAAEQRSELTRELHDVGAHALTVVCLQAGAAQRLWSCDPSTARRAIDTLVAVVHENLSGLDQSLAVLTAGPQSPALDAAGLDLLTGLARALGLDLEVVIRGRSGALPPAAARTAFGVARESLTNAARHAPHTRVRLEVDHLPTGLDLCVTDTGAGVGPVAVPLNGAGMGLLGLRERVEACGGDLHHGPSGGGFTVRVHLPTEAAILLRAVRA